MGTMADQWIQRGVQQGESLILIELLRDKFQTISDDDSQKIKKANTETRSILRYNIIIQ